MLFLRGDGLCGDDLGDDGLVDDGLGDALVDDGLGDGLGVASRDAYLFDNSAQYFAVRWEIALFICFF